MRRALPVGKAFHLWLLKSVVLGFISNNADAQLLLMGKDDTASKIREILNRLHIKALEQNLNICHDSLDRLSDATRAFGFQNKSLRHKVRRLTKVLDCHVKQRDAIKEDYNVAVDRLEVLQDELQSCDKSRLVHKLRVDNYAIMLTAYDQTNKEAVALFLEAQKNYLRTLDKLCVRDDKRHIDRNNINADHVTWISSRKSKTDR